MGKMFQETRFEKERSTKYFSVGTKEVLFCETSFLWSRLLIAGDPMNKRHNYIIPKPRYQPVLETL